MLILPQRGARSRRGGSGVEKGGDACVTLGGVHVNAYGQQQELPYTGLEGYYAGSIRTSEYPGMASEEVVQEEAHIGIEILRTIKKEAPPPQG